MLLALQTVPADLWAPRFSSALQAIVRLRVDDIESVYFFFDEILQKLIAGFHTPSDSRFGVPLKEGPPRSVFLPSPDVGKTSFEISARKCAHRPNVLADNHMGRP